MVIPSPDGHDGFLLEFEAINGWVEGWLKRIFHNRPVVLHGGSNDIRAFQICTDAFATSELVDTQKLYAGLRQMNDPTPGLANCARIVLGVTEYDEHNPVADAEMTRRLYLNKFPEKELPKAVGLPKGAFTHGQRGRGGRGRAAPHRANMVAVRAMEIIML